MPNRFNNNEFDPMRRNDHPHNGPRPGANQVHHTTQQNSTRDVAPASTIRNYEKAYGFHRAAIPFGFYQNRNGTA
jgi:hypothetical protein